MRGINSWHGIGNLGADPDVRYSANGTAVTKFRIGVNEEWRDKQTGEKQSRTEWVRVTCFGKLGEIAGEFLKTGAPVYIEGSLRTSKYEKEGQTHYSTEIVANTMQMLGGKPGNAQGSQQQSQNQPGQRPSGGADFDDDIPF